MDRSRTLVTVLFFVLVAVGGTIGALLMSGGKGAGWVFLGMLLVLIFAGFVWRTTYRWAQRDRQRWAAHSRRRGY